MASRSKKAFYLLGLFFILASAGAMRLSQAIVVLEITDETSHQHILRHRFTPGETFAFKYIHSVQQTPVWEYYTLDASGRVLLTATKVKSVGYGMPKPARGDSYTFKDGYFMVDNLNQPINALLIRNTFIRPMEIHYADMVFKLRDLANKGDLIRISGYRTTWIGLYRDHRESS